jgi:hypothetical protein
MKLKTIWNQKLKMSLKIPIEWWSKNSNKYQILSEIAFDYLIIPTSSVPSEQIFSKARNTITKLRNRSDKSTVRDFMLLNPSKNI